MKYNLSGGHQKSYLAAARRVIRLPPEEKSYLAAARRVIGRPSEELRGSVKNTWVFSSISEPQKRN